MAVSARTIRHSRETRGAPDGSFPLGRTSHGTVRSADHSRIKFDISTDQEKTMRSVLLWFIGVPIPLILLLALCTHHF
jgi:hypothetical protein